MSSKEKLTGVELIDCARANTERGVDTAAVSCGYGSDIASFQQAISQACDEMGVDASNFAEIVDPPKVKKTSGFVIAPDNAANL
ncbi:MAG: hypothetical protein AAGE92_00240 [Cyanobacteria bacterium P01_G01_bin.4]